MCPSLRKMAFCNFFARAKGIFWFLKWVFGYPRLTAAKRRSAQSKERTPETTERRHRRLEHRRVIRETRGRISRTPTPGRPPREITRTHLSPGTFQSDLPCRSLSPPSRRREPRARPCPGPPRAPAATVPPSSARGRARYAPDDRPIARVTVRPEGSARTRGALRRVASWPKGQFITWPPGVLVVAPAETYRAYRAVPGRPDVSRRSRVVTRSHFNPERRPEDRVEHPSN